MNDGKAKQQIVDKIKSSSNILVTVSTDPSVDALSAALGLTLLLNKMDKHATAVFSGAIPPAITFLDPQKTFENTVNSLRDFIIALDKEKADHLRYKVDGDVVKIFITPYRTTISSDDLEFSQGDYNVELVLALGVKNQDHLDKALAAHGRILHDATVATISVGGEKSELGSIDWSDENASSLSELLVTLSDGLKKGEKGLLDEQIATAFLTGIVAATDRFSNNLTTSRAMTVAAQLMGAGANQQLIASKLEQANEIRPEEIVKVANADGTTDLSEGKSTKVTKEQQPPKEPAKEPEQPEEKKPDGSLVISHEKRGDLDEVSRATLREQQEAAARAAEEELARRTEQPQQAVPIVEQPEPTPEPQPEPAPETAPQPDDEAAKAAEQNLSRQLEAARPASPGLSVADLQRDLAEASSDVDKAAEQAPTTVAPLSGAVSESAWKSDQPPSMGGTLNATTEQAANDARREIEEDRNRTILSHGNPYVSGETPAFQSPINAAARPQPNEPGLDLFASPAATPNAEERAPDIQPAPASPMVTLADIDRQNRGQTPDAGDHDEARAAVHAAFDAPQPTPPPAPAGLPPLPPMPDFSTLPPMPAAAGQSPEPLPPEDKLGDMLPPAPAPTPAAPNDPSQFRIPGQP